MNTTYTDINLEMITCKMPVGSVTGTEPQPLIRFEGGESFIPIVTPRIRCIPGKPMFNPSEGFRFALYIVGGMSNPANQLVRTLMVPPSLITTLWENMSVPVPVNQGGPDPIAISGAAVALMASGRGGASRLAGFDFQIINAHPDATMEVYVDFFGALFHE